MSSSAKTVAIVQSSYIPWKGYFDLINAADEFILYDDQQYTRRDWRNRNRIKTPQGVTWLSIPVRVKGRYFQRIDETEIADPAWAADHWRTIEHAYRQAPFFDHYREALEALYRGCDEPLLSRVNRRFLETLCDLLRIPARLTWSTDYEAEGRKTERLVSLCRAARGTMYLSGPTARAYIDERLFEEAGLALRYMDYAGYPEYGQLHPPFEHAVSVIDLLVHTGPEARTHFRSFDALDGRDAA